MNHIRTLDPMVSNQIAAGEVIERPANACKELVENALDAGARHIEIDLEEGGKKLIRVRDDGCGMSPGDAVLCLQRHATSKVQTAEDLEAIATLGFRGEALPSIASVSCLELISRPPDNDLGTRLMVQEGVVTEVSEIGCPEGTQVSVHRLFANTPARFKFLKSDSAEAARTTEFIGRLALAHPDVAFSLRHNGHPTLDTDGRGDATGTLAGVLGREIARAMLPLPGREENPNIVVRGFAAPPHLTRANRSWQICLVNGRVVKSRVVQHAVSAAYEGLLHGHERYPVVVLDLRVPHQMVDVNVHPAKLEVRFAREGEVHHAVRVALRDVLLGARVTPAWNLQQAAPDRIPIGDAPGPDTAPFLSEPSGLPAAPATPASWQPRLPDLTPEMPPGVPRLRPLAQIVNQSYILCEAEDGLYIVCQHRAHERVLVEQALQRAAQGPVTRQHLVIPLTVELGPRAAGAVEQHRELLTELGFEVEDFGGHALLVRAVPAMLGSGDAAGALLDLLEDLHTGQTNRSLEERRRRLLSMLACRAAIKAGDTLSSEHMRGLVDDLLQTGSPSICPHGQPILIKISTFELDRRFERPYARRN